MPRPKLAVRSVEKNISLPEDLAAMVDLELYSELEGKVPFGAWKGFITRVIRQHFERQVRADALHEQIVDAFASGDKEGGHSTADYLMCEELTRLGYHKAASAFLRAGKWYA